MALWITAFLGAATVGALHKAGEESGLELGAGAAGAEVLLSPRAAPSAREEQRDGHEQQPLLIPHQRVTARLRRSGECSAGAGGRSQTSTMLWIALLPDWALLFFFFFSEVYGLGILQNLALGSNIK